MKLLFSIATVFIFLGFTVGSYGRATVYVSSTQDEALVVGDQMHLNIQIREGGSVSGYELTVGFDPTALRYIEGANADYLPAGAFTIPPIVTENAVYMTATSGAEVALASEGTLATLTFEVIAAKGSTIKLMDVILSDSVGMPLPVTSENGRIVTIELPPNWDVNEDGRVNILDLTLVASNLMADVPVNPRVDVNKDGNVNILDLVLVAQNLDAAGGNEPEVRVKLVVPTFASLPPFERFEAEKQAIQELYTEFYNAFNDFDIKVVGETFNTSTIAFGTVFAGNEPVPVATGWNHVKTNILGLWNGIGTKGNKWGQNDRLTDFWIRYKGSKLEAAAIGYNCYKGSFPGETHLYLIKDDKGWKIYELDSITENNLGVFGFHKGKPRIEKFIKVTREAKKMDPAHTFDEIPVVPPDHTSPEITGGTVFDGEEDVDPAEINEGRIEITFNEVVSGNIALQTEGGDDVGWIGKVEGTKGILELVKGKEIGNETTYVIVGKVADAAGNETEVNITFTTMGKE